MVDEVAVLRARLLDTTWVLACPVVVQKNWDDRLNLVLNMMLGTVLKDYVASLGGQPCPAAAIDHESTVSPALFWWNPANASLVGTAEHSSVFLTPKILRTPKIVATPILSSIRLFKHLTAPTIAIKTKVGGLAMGPSGTIPPEIAATYPPECYSDGKWKNCFLFCPRPFPSIERVKERFETICNIRSIDIEEEMEALNTFIRSNVDRPPARTERFIKTLGEVVITIMGPSYTMILDFEGVEHV